MIDLLLNFLTQLKAPCGVHRKGLLKAFTLYSVQRKMALLLISIMLIISIAMMLIENILRPPLNTVA